MSDASTLSIFVPSRIEMNKLLPSDTAARAGQPRVDDQRLTTVFARWEDSGYWSASLPVGEICQDLQDARATIADLRQQNEALTKERDALERGCQHAGVCMSCVHGCVDPHGCFDCLNTGFSTGNPYERADASEARAIAADAERDAAIERAAKIADAEHEKIVSDEYAYAVAASDWSPGMASSERYACRNIAAAIRALSTTKKRP